MKKWKCEECDTITDEDKILIAESPFDPANMITGCPFCRSVNSLQAACDEYGCEKLASCGFPTAEGYRVTCGEHMRKYKEKTEEINEIHRLESKIEKLEADLLEAQKPDEPAKETQVTQ